MHLVIFEGSRWSELAPITLTRPTFSLMCGASTLLDKQIRAIKPSRLTLWVRPEMEGFVRERVIPHLDIPVSINTPLDEERAILITGRILFMSAFDAMEEDSVVLDDDLVTLANVQMPGLSYNDVLTRSDRFKSLRQLSKAPSQALFARNLCDLIAWNEEAIMADSIHWSEGPPAGSGIHLINPESIHAHKNVKISPGVVLDASKGPILLEDTCVIGANSVVEGPCYIGSHSRIQPLSFIRPGTTIGPTCRVGGEVSNSIFIGFSNKSHDGFLGDSYIGAWVNMGAGTISSNLKSTYGPITMQIGSRKFPADRQLMGSIIGDHVKTSTGALLPAGCYIGPCTMLATTDVLPPFIKGFTFWTDADKQPVRLDKIGEVAERMMERRHLHYDELEKQILQYAEQAVKEVEK